MENISIVPNKKLKTKSYMVIFTISLLLLISGLVINLLIPLNGKADFESAGRIIWPIIISIIILLWIISVPIIILWINNLKYFIGEERITIHKGILSKIEQNIPYHAVTDFMLHRSLYDRFLGIGAIKIQTAGQSSSPTGYEGVLSGLHKSAELLEELRSRLKYYQANEDVETTLPAMENIVILKDILKEVRLLRKEITERNK